MIVQQVNCMLLFHYLSVRMVRRLSTAMLWQRNW